MQAADSALDTAGRAGIGEGLAKRQSSLPSPSKAPDLLAWAGKATPFAEKLGALPEPATFANATPAAHGFLAALCCRALPRRTWVVVTDLRAQENVFNDLASWLGHERLCFLPQLEAPAFDDVLPDTELLSERLAVLHRWSLEPDSKAPPVLVLVAESLDEDIPAPEALQEQELRIKRGATLRLESLTEKLDAAGYDRVPVVAERGQFAVRGGLVDVFSWQAAAPVRIEFFDVEVESIRTFDVNHQTSVNALPECVVLLARGGEARKFVTLRSTIAPGDLVIALETDALPAATVRITSALDGDVQDEDTSCLEHPLGNFATGDFILQESRRTSFRRQLDDWEREGWCVAMFFNTEGEIERFREIMPEVAARLDCRLGQLNHGFTIPAAKLAVLADAEVFGRYQHTRARRLFMREQRELGRRRIFDIRELDEGELVVHQDYGVAKYTGLQRPQGDAGDEVMVLEFAEKARLFVGLDQAHLVSRYVGTGKKAPPLSKLGDEKWSKTRKQAEKSILDYAARLLSVQAERETRDRPAHPADTKWQWEFENSFVFKETPDQLRAITDAKADMESDKPMDRLVCGDVGFGKTEVAIRAAFKAVMGGRQVAFLAPTTVLAEQHWRTLRERMSDYPVRIDLMCRWRSRKEQLQTIQDLATHQCDIVVGTHRLLSKDIVYKDLGLVIIDEEQRFGVAHKEKFKQLFRMVDVLTLSATPIPRTLYMALMGARDMSTIETPPANRVPVQTHICPYDERIIRDAIQRELKRGGQVFFLHNRVGDIENIASKIRMLCPGAKVDFGHGQMDEDDLEDTMMRFVEGQTDVFVCTTIVESGIDIPNANTIIIDRADRFGLADLYQLRGRVGRAGHQAYAYLMLPRDLLATGDARKRVNAIRQYSQLGAGLKIAMRDLEIRGAGNLLGTQQSGHIFNIGFELYCNLLKRAVTRVKGGVPEAGRSDVALRTDFVVTSESEWQPAMVEAGKAPAFIPEAWLPEAKLRIAAYKEAAEAATLEATATLRASWRDRFGELPEPAENLLRLADLRLTAGVRKIQSIEMKSGKLMLQRRDQFVTVAGKFPRLESPLGADRIIEATRVTSQL